MTGGLTQRSCAYDLARSWDFPLRCRGTPLLRSFCKRNVASQLKPEHFNGYPPLARKLASKSCRVADGAFKVFCPACCGKRLNMTTISG